MISSFEIPVSFLSCQSLHQSEQVTVKVTEFGLIKKLLRSCDFKTILSNLCTLDGSNVHHANVWQLLGRPTPSVC